jgi:hypothetical protein
MRYLTLTKSLIVVCSLWTTTWASFPADNPFMPEFKEKARKLLPEDLSKAWDETSLVQVISPLLVPEAQGRLASLMAFFFGDEKRIPKHSHDKVNTAWVCFLGKLLYAIEMPSRLHKEAVEIFKDLSAEEPFWNQFPKDFMRLNTISNTLKQQMKISANIAIQNQLILSGFSKEEVSLIPENQWTLFNNQSIALLTKARYLSNLTEILQVRAILELAALHGNHLKMFDPQLAEEVKTALPCSACLSTAKATLGIPSKKEEGDDDDTSPESSEKEDPSSSDESTNTPSSEE